MNIPKKNRLRKNNLLNDSKKDLKNTRTKSFSKNMDSNNSWMINRPMNKRANKIRKTDK